MAGLRCGGMLPTGIRLSGAAARHPGPRAASHASEAHTRGAFAHVHNTTRPYHLPEIGTHIADKPTATGGPSASDAAGHKTSAVALARIPADDARRKASHSPA